MRLHWFLPILVCWNLPAQTTQPNQPAGWQTIFTDDFERASLGSNWQMPITEDPAASWNIVKDGANSVLSGQGHSFLYLWAGNWSDYRFKARVKPLRNGIHLNFRNSGCIRYFVSLGPGSLGLNKTLPCGTQIPGLAAAPGSYQINQWYVVEIVGVGPNVKVYVDGALKIDYTDPDPVLFGRAAFESLSDAQAYLDDVEISGPPAAAIAQKLAWVKVGGPIGGLGYDVRMRPDNPDTMFVTDTFSGVNKSVDGGRTWTASNNGITTRTGLSGDAIPVFSLTIDFHNPNVIWAGTQNARGIFKSVDGGKSWAEKTNGIVERSGISFRGFAVDPNDSNTVYAAAEISSSEWAGRGIQGIDFDLTKGVVYRTRDGGQSWTAIWRGDNLARYVWIDPRDSNTIYISTGIFDREAANSDLIHGSPGGVGIVKTSDGGQTWVILSQVNGLANLYVGSLFLHPQNPDILLAGAGMVDASKGGGMYLSTDRGATWRRGVGATDHLPIQDVISSVEFSVSDPRVAYAGSPSTFYRSNDGGVTWTVQSGGPPYGYYGPPGVRAGFPVDLQVDPRNPNRVFINNYGGGNLLSEDGGITWQVASRGYTGAQLHRVALDPADAGNLFAIGRSGPFRSPDRGENWIGLLNGPANLAEWYSVALNPAAPSTVLISDEFFGILFRSTDNGLNWKKVFQNPQASGVSGSRHGFKALAFAPSNPQTVYAGMCRDRNTLDAGNPPPSFGVFKSADGGIAWKDSNDSVSAGQNINVLLIDPHDPNTVYAGTVASGVLKSRDGGATWKKSNQGLKTLDVRSLAFDPANSAVVYAGLERGGLYKSADGGATWQMSGSGMDSLASVRDMVADPTNSGILYAADITTGVYRSDDRGGLWVAINKGLSTRAVKSLAIASDASTLYAATEGEGVFRLDLLPASGGGLGLTSAATFQPGGDLAAESIASAFGTSLADAPTAAGPGALPTTIGDTSVSVMDASGAERSAPLFFVSPGQINFLLPSGLAEGSAVVRVFRRNNVVARGSANVDTVAPGLFTANADGKGVPAAVALRVAASGAQSPLDVYRCGTAQGSCAPVPIDLGAATDQVILELFGTGIRGRSALTAVTAKIGGQDAEVQYAGPQGGFMGLDQVNVRVPRSLAGRGVVDVVLVVDGRAANTVTVRIL